MIEQKYKVVLYTPLGERKGMLGLVFSDDKISGYLEILGHRESVLGDLDHGGNCKLAVKIVTLMSKFCYEAVGRIDDKSVDLMLYGERNELSMKGSAVIDLNEKLQGEYNELH